ncbi:hypothetical protein JTE90_023539 [Oedothorax gibbosus]|uniref:THAP-type domain-containing protein n=1 Tax=Oedothorax gibbosus TaxID=931172 RepID=A0AAV6UK61_9ARAC|nr:hypothetical protein JTE90_023539 [Oedothorax gibbosus]
MPNNCAVLNCRAYYKKGHVTLHSFPKDPERRQQWEATVKVKKPNFTATNNSKICSKHFESECFETAKSGGTWLKSDAMPTIFDFLEQPGSSKISNKKSPKKRKESDDSDNESESDDETTQRRPSDDESPSSYYSSFMMNKAKRLCYLGDFDEDTVTASPENAQKFFHIAKAEVEGKKRHIRLIRKKNDKLKKRANKIVQMLKVLKEKHIITDSS